MSIEVTQHHPERIYLRSFLTDETPHFVIVTIADKSNEIDMYLDPEELTKIATAFISTGRKLHALNRKYSASKD